MKSFGPTPLTWQNLNSKLSFQPWTAAEAAAWLFFFLTFQLCFPRSFLESPSHMWSSEISHWFEGSVHLDLVAPLPCLLPLWSLLPQVPAASAALNSDPPGFLSSVRRQLSAWALLLSCMEVLTREKPVESWSHRVSPFFKGHICSHFCLIVVARKYFKQLFFMSYPEFITVTGWRVSLI